MENVDNIQAITNIQVHNIIEVPCKTIDLDVVISMVTLPLLAMPVLLLQHKQIHLPQL
jgi:hypothetical protein